jgi:hypothetical protein
MISDHVMYALLGPDVFPASASATIPATVNSMENQSVADLAREYGLDGSEYEHAEVDADEYAIKLDEPRAMGYYNVYPDPFAEYSGSEDHIDGSFDM